MTFSAIQFLILAALLAVAAADSAYPAYPAHSKGYEYVIWIRLYISIPLC